MTETKRPDALGEDDLDDVQGGVTYDSGRTGVVKGKDPAKGVVLLFDEADSVTDNAKRARHDD